jgi:hypothetical protein
VPATLQMVLKTLYTDDLILSQEWPFRPRAHTEDAKHSELLSQLLTAQPLVKITVWFLLVLNLFYYPRIFQRAIGTTLFDVIYSMIFQINLSIRPFKFSTNTYLKNTVLHRDKLKILLEIIQFAKDAQNLSRSGSRINTTFHLFSIPRCNLPHNES